VWADVGHLHWSSARGVVGSLIKIFLKVALVGLTWAFFQHLFSGLRHLVMDSGMGFELKANKAGAVATIVGSAIATVLIWAYWLGAFQ
jgi:succinate dehydrogenase / fumarate reductase cytochrome b subunit